MLDALSGILDAQICRDRTTDFPMRGSRNLFRDEHSRREHEYRRSSMKRFPLGIYDLHCDVGNLKPPKARGRFGKTDRGENLSEKSEEQMTRGTDICVEMRVHLTLPPAHSGRSTFATTFFPGVIKGPLGSAPWLIANWPLNIIAAHKSGAVGHFRFSFSLFPYSFNY